MTATLQKVQGSISTLAAVTKRSDMPTAKDMDKFLDILGVSLTVWTAEDKVSFKSSVEALLTADEARKSPLIFERYNHDLRKLAGLPVPEAKKTKRVSSFEEAVKGMSKLEAELALLRADVAELKEAMARKGKAKKTKQPELPM